MSNNKCKVIVACSCEKKRINKKKGQTGVDEKGLFVRSWPRVTIGTCDTSVRFLKRARARAASKNPHGGERNEGENDASPFRSRVLR